MRCLSAFTAAESWTRLCVGKKKAASASSCKTPLCVPVANAAEALIYGGEVCSILSAGLPTCSRSATALEALSSEDSAAFLCSAGWLQQHGKF